ncbi:MAG: hypothetical protein QXI33_02690 [Candidatus Pacearchaeota archaeon]
MEVHEANRLKNAKRFMLSLVEKKAFRQDTFVLLDRDVESAEYVLERMLNGNGYATLEFSCSVVYYSIRYSDIEGVLGKIMNFLSKYNSFNGKKH